MTSPQVLKQTEHDELAKLEASYAELGKRSNNALSQQAAFTAYVMPLYQDMAMRGVDHTAAINAADERELTSLRAFCDHLGQWHAHFAGFEGTARTLATSGLPRLAVRLREICEDLTGLLDVYRKMCATMIESRNTRLRIFQGAANEINRVIQETANRNRGVFNAFNTRWSNEAFNKCPSCGALLQSRSLPICWNCKIEVVRF